MAVKQASAAVGEHAQPGDSILLLSAPHTEETNSTCVDSLTPVDAEQTLVLWITLLDGPAERLNHWSDHVEADPQEVAVIDVRAGGDLGQPSADDAPDETVSITRVRSPRNLTRLGVEIVDQLSEWERNEDGQIVVCFHSLSTFLHYVDVKDAFRFLHALRAQFDRTGAIAHFHMDPTIHDQQTVNAVLPLFRSVAELDGERWTFKRR